MATFLMFGKYTLDAAKQISADRTEKAAALLKKHGGELKSAYAMLGENDLVLIVDLPGTAEAMKASVGLTRITGIPFSTAAAVPVVEFDKLMADA